MDERRIAEKWDNMKYKVYFETFGKKLKMEVEANSEGEAMHIIRNKIKILKVKQISEPSGDETVEMLKGMFGMK